MRKSIPCLKTATALKGYRLYVSFEDGVDGIIDLNKWRGKGVFKFWDEENNYANFIITPDKKIEWNEDIDMDPDAFYLQLTQQTLEAYAGNQQLLWDNH